MPYSRTFVCLAASRKHSGTCVAGKELEGELAGRWIRPVSSFPLGELVPAHMRLREGGLPRPLDLLTVRLLHPLPHGPQTENHLLDPEARWEKAGDYDRAHLDRLCDRPPALWINGYSSASGVNDRVPEARADAELDCSLYFLRSEALQLQVRTVGEARKIRAWFYWGGLLYALIVTDPDADRRFYGKPDDVYTLNDRPYYLCISLGEPYEGYRYKLVAAIL